MPNSNHLLQALLDGTTDNVVLIDLDYRILCFNKNLQDRLEVFFKKKVSEGDDYRDYVAPELLQPFIDAVARAARGETYVVDRETTAGGVSFWFQSQFNPVYKEDRLLLGVAMTATDITEKKIAELNLQSLTDSFRAVVENITESVIYLDNKGKVVLFNELAKNHIRYNINKELVKDGNFREFLYPGHEALFEKCYGEALEGKASEEEYLVSTANGGWTWVRSRSFPVYDNNKNIIGVSFFTLVIDERKKIELALQRSEANLATVFENTEVGHALFDKDIRIVTFNKAFSQVSLFATGMQVDKGMLISEVFAHDSSMQNAFNQVEQTRASVVYDTRYENGEREIYLTIIIAPVFSGNEIMGSAMTVVDITLRKQQDVERQNMIADLQQRNQMLEQFAYIVSHNIRSPLVNILGLTNLVQEKLGAEELSYMLGALKKSAQNLDVVLHDLNDNLQIRRGIVEPKTKVDLNKLVINFKKSADALVSNKKIVIETEFSEISQVYTVESYLQNIFNNLLMNSVKFARTGVAPEIHIWTIKKKDETEIHFKDNGKGIDLNRYGMQLFGLYKRFDMSVEGKGLGLFMVKSQIEALNGTINVDSTPDSGTHFIVSLPVN